MNRYLIYFSYIGTRFKYDTFLNHVFRSFCLKLVLTFFLSSNRGVQKQYDKGIPLFKNETIQSLLESALLELKKKPLNIPVVYPASR